MRPACGAGKRDQNSIILLSRQRWDVSGAVELTDTVHAALDPDHQRSVAAGDLFALRVKDHTGEDYMLVSFHGDTNGTVTIPLVQAVHDVASSTGCRLIVGIDANTYQPGTKKLLPAAEFLAFCGGVGLSTCWGEGGESLGAAGCTTYNARTYLQPQLNKAVGRGEVSGDTHRHLKDYLLCYAAQGGWGQTLKDNTGKGPVRWHPSLRSPAASLETLSRPHHAALSEPSRNPLGSRAVTCVVCCGVGAQGNYDEDLIFPTLHFPSDHGIVISELRAV